MPPTRLHTPRSLRASECYTEHVLVCLHNADRSGLFHASQPQGKSWSVSSSCWEIRNRSDRSLSSRGTFKSSHMPTHIYITTHRLTLTYLPLETGLYRALVELGMKRFFFIKQSGPAPDKGICVDMQFRLLMCRRGWWSAVQMLYRCFFFFFFSGKAVKMIILGQKHILMSLSLVSLSLNKC